MNQYTLPTPPVSGNFTDQEDFAKSVNSAVRKMIIDQRDGGANDCFGEVQCGLGGGYAVDLSNEDGNYFFHPIERVVMLVKPEKEYPSFAELINDRWLTTAQEEQEGWECDIDLSEVPVEYVFETIPEAEAWLKDQLAMEEDGRAAHKEHLDELTHDREAYKHMTPEERDAHDNL
jgi:hypothetical protein